MLPPKFNLILGRSALGPTYKIWKVVCKYLRFEGDKTHIFYRGSSKCMMEYIDG